MGVFWRKDQRDRKVYYIDYYVQEVRRRERVGYSRTEANEALESRRTDIRRKKFDRILPEPRYTLEQIKDEYLRKHSKTKSASGYKRDAGILEKHMIPVFGKVSLNQIMLEQVEDYLAERIADGAAPATINKEIQVLKHVVKKAVEWGKIHTNQIVNVKPLKTPPGRVRYLELDQIPKLLEKCPAWLRPIVVIALNTGMRRGNIVNLKRTNIDKRNRLIRLEKTKNNDAQILPMNQTVYEVISSLPPRVDTPYLFVEEDGKRISPDKVTMAFKRACEAAGINDFRLHDLRHHFASWLAMSGQNQRTLMELLGHKTPAMTARYTHLSDRHLRTAVEVLDNLSKVQGEEDRS